MQTPETFGRYIIRQRVGYGGMAHVYQAHDPRFGRDVALKVIPAAFMADPTFRGRFEQEARTIAALEHPAIVPVYDFGEDNGQLYLVMRYMSGGSLSDQIHQRPFSLSEAIPIIQQIGDALDHAHQQGVIHRDLKPANILFDRYGNPFLSDFGIVKLAEATSSFTGSGIVGTPAYMSPEQIHGDVEIDGRADIYTLGILFFEMLTGIKPYRADTPIKQMMAHVLDPIPSIRQVRADLPSVLDPIITRVMAKDRKQRYATAHTFTTALTSALPNLSLSDLPLSAAGSGRRFTPPLPAAVEAERSHPDQPTMTIAPANTPVTETAKPVTGQSAAEQPTVVAGMAPLTTKDGLRTDTAVAPPTGKKRSWLLWGSGALIAILLLLALTLLSIFPAAEGTGSQPESGRTSGILPETPPPTYTPTSPAPPVIVQPNAAEPTTESATPTVEPATTLVIGQSLSGIPITAYRFGQGERRVVLVGGIHAGFAPASVDVAVEAVSFFRENENIVPDNLSLWIIPSLNPDSATLPGELAGRLNDNGVDLNRNWGCLWQPSPSWRGTPVPGMGGAAPFSEPEVSGLADFLQNDPPAAVLFWGAQAQNGLVSAGSCEERPFVSTALARAFANGVGYQYVDFEGLTQQKVPGDATNWLDQRGIPAMTVLLPTYDAVDWENNLDGIRALLTAVATETETATPNTP